jgi:flagellar motor switch protein FliG
MTSEAAKLPPPPARLAIEHKPPAPARAGFTAPQKAALIIAALGPEAAGPIIERIGDKHLKAFAEAYARLQNVARKDLSSVVLEFLTNVSGKEDGLKGGFAEARSLVSHFKGEDSAAKLLDAIDAPGGRTVWQKLAAVEDQTLADYLAAKSPQTIAVVMARMDLDKASNILALLPDDVAQHVITRLTKPAPVRPEALRALAAAIESELLAPLRKAAKSGGPGEKIGAMLNNMSEEKRESFLQFIASKAPDLIDDVKSAILTFKDIPARLPAKAVTQVTREVDVQTVLKAAKYGRKNAPETVEFLFANISQRLVQQYEEQMKEMKPVTVADAEAAQGQIMIAIRKLVAEGAFELNKIETEEQTEEEFI